MPKRWRGENSRDAGSHEVSQAAPKTLVVCPTSMLGVWESEAKKFVPNLSVSVKEVATAADIVITTYRAVVSDNQRQWPRYRDVTWGRIILDEAHAIGFDSSATAQSLYRLKANYRWCVTATPEAKPHILYSMYRFLKISPFHGNHIPTEAFPLRPSFRGFDNRRVTPTSIVREMYSTTNSNTRGNIYQVMADLAQEVCYADDFCTEKTVEYEVVSVTPKDNTLYETLLSKFKQEYSTRVVKNARFIHFQMVDTGRPQSVAAPTHTLRHPDHRGGQPAQPGTVHTKVGRQWV